MMQFERPELLALLPLALLPLLQGVLGSRPTVRFPGAVEMARQKSWRVRLLALLPVLQAGALAGLALAAARPYEGSRAVYDERDGRDVFIAVDTSESMKGVDFAGPQGARARLAGALDLAGQFVRRRAGDRIGLIVFGGRAVTQCPLTFDRDVALWLMGQVRAEMLGKRTALGEAIALGAARLAGRGGALVLISDGQNTAGDVSPSDAARAAAQRGVRVYCIGVGARGTVPIPVRLPSGRTVLRNREYPLDEETLRAVAAATGGRYFRATDAAGLSAVFAEIDRLEPRPTRAPARLRYGRKDAHWMLLSCGFVAALMLLSCGALRTAPMLR